MAFDPDPLGKELDTETRRRMFNELAYDNMNSTRVTVDLPGDGREVKVPHGFSFAPSWENLTLRPHNSNADTGMVYLTRDPDSGHIYVASPRAGRVVLEITHPPKNQ